MSLQIEEMKDKVHCMDVKEGLKLLSSESIDMVITSPPYWGLRDYGKGTETIWDEDKDCEHDWIHTIIPPKHKDDGKTKSTLAGTKTQEQTQRTPIEFGFCSKCGGWSGQLGLEPDPDLYVKHLCDIMDGIKRVLKDTGTAWINISDTYISSGLNKIRRNLTEIDKSWMAALIDGEGCIQIHKQIRENSTPSYQADISVGMIDKEMVEYAYKITNIGSLTLQNRNVWDWGVRGQDAGHLARLIYPYLKIKKERAKLLISLCENLKGPKDGRFAKKENIEYREYLFNLMRDLNQRRMNTTGVNIQITNPINIMNKSLAGIPFRFALQMVNRGWILRNTIIWHKSSCLPSPVKDRFTTDFEYIFFFVKSPKYYFEQQLEPLKTPYRLLARDNRQQFKKWSGDGMGYDRGNAKPLGETISHKGRNKRTVWNISPKGFTDAHFAIYPEELLHVPIKAGCPEGGIVLDPFMGSGTTAIAAKRLKRYYVGFEISPKYVEMAEKRIFEESTKKLRINLDSWL